MTGAPADAITSAPGPTAREAPPNAAELVIVSSGPGEVSNWAVPMAQAAAAWAAARATPLGLSLILPPCQFASGQEIPYAQRQGLFARILGPAACLAIASGVRRLPMPGRGALLHLGGDFWYSATLARRLGLPAFAYAETPLIGRRARRFQRVFLPSQPLADRLTVSGAASDRLSVVGDLRVDHLSAFRALGGTARQGLRVALLPGSRRWIVARFLPFLLGTAADIRAARPDVEFSLIASPFLAGETLTRMLEGHRNVLRDLTIEIVQDDRFPALTRCDLAITHPGTNTVELAILGVPMLIVLPLDRPGSIRTEGLSEWLGRIPGLGAAIKGAMAWRLARHPGLLAWPNREAGRPVVPEMVGYVTPADAACRALEMLADRDGLERMARDLRSLYATPPGVAERMLDEMASCFGAASGSRTAVSTVSLDAHPARPA